MSKGPKYSIQYYKRISKKFKERKRQFNILNAVKMLKRAEIVNQRKIEYQNQWMESYN